jgi:hypothetical protein
LGGIIRTLVLVILLSSLLATLSSCGKEEYEGQEEASAADVKLFSTNIHISVAQHTLILPFIALDDYAYRKQSFSLNRKGDNESAQAAWTQFLHDSTNPQKPLVVDGLSVAVRTYGWDNRRGKVCPLLTHKWARSICDNPWAAIQQALPNNRFRLVDLSRLQVGDPRGPADCRDDGKQSRPLPQRAGEALIVCTAMVYGGQDDQFHHAVVRIDGDLGALWTVWRYGQNGETAEAMTEREGKAIVAFVKYALGQSEKFSALRADMCGLRRPGSADNPHSPDCRRSALTPLSRNQ